MFEPCGLGKYCMVGGIVVGNDMGCRVGSGNEWVEVRQCGWPEVVYVVEVQEVYEWRLERGWG